MQLRLIVLVATLAAVAHSTTLLYPSSYRPVGWPLQSQYPLNVQYSNYYPYTTVYRYPLQVQLRPYQYTYQYAQQTPLYTQTRTVPLVWGRSFGEQASPAAAQVASSSPAYAQQVNQQYPVAQPVAPAVPAAQAAPVVAVGQPSTYSSQQAFVGQQAYVAQTGYVGQPVPAPVSSFAQPPVHAGHFVSHLSASVQPQQQSFASPRSSHEAGLESVAPAYQVSQPAYPQYSAPLQPAVAPAAVPLAPQPGQAVVSFIPSGAIAQPVPAHPQSAVQPIAYSVDYPRPQIVGPGEVQPSTAHIAQIPLQPSYVSIPIRGHPQQAVVSGQHQVTQVTIPGQVGVGGGYSSATFYETAPASVVIPSVPYPQEPIVAADAVKAVAPKAPVDGQTVQNSPVQSHVPAQNLRAVQAY